MMDYAGDVTSKRAWEILSSDSNSILVDVRTSAEFSYVGITDLSSLQKSPLLIEWVQFPNGRKNPTFEQELTDQLSSIGADEGSTILFLCRSGARSNAAATAATTLGYSNCFNISDGFEGDLDANHHRGMINGWRASNLPWRQS